MEVVDLATGLSNEYLFAKIGFDTAENEPPKFGSANILEKNDFLSQSFCRNSRPSHPLPSLIVRCLRWLIRGCRRNQGSMPSSPKVLMGGKIWKNSFTLKNSSEICTHRRTRARLPTLVVASLTALGFFTRNAKNTKTWAGREGAGGPTPSLEPFGSLQSLECLFYPTLAPLSLHPPLTKIGRFNIRKHSTILASF